MGLAFQSIYIYMQNGGRKLHRCQTFCACATSVLAAQRKSGKLLNNLYWPHTIFHIRRTLPAFRRLRILLPSGTQEMVVDLKNKIQITIDNIAIERTTSYKLLGIGLSQTSSGIIIPVRLSKKEGTSLLSKSVKEIGAPAKDLLSFLFLSDSISTGIR